MGGIVSIGLTALAFSATSYAFGQIDKHSSDNSRDRHYRKEEEIQQEKVDEYNKRQQRLDRINHKRMLQKKAAQTISELDEDEEYYSRAKNRKVSNQQQQHPVLSEYYNYNNEHHIKDTVLIAAVTLLIIIAFHYLWKAF